MLNTKPCLIEAIEDSDIQNRMLPIKFEIHSYVIEIGNVIVYRYYCVVNIILLSLLLLACGRYNQV